MSDVLGRRQPLLVSILVYVFATVLCAAAPGVEVLVVSRLLQGVSAAAGVVIARAVVRDFYSGAEAARYLSRLILIFGLAPVLAPSLGAAMLTVTSWRGLFGLLGVAALALLAAVAAWLPETLPRGQRQLGGVRGTAGSLRALVADRSFVAYASALGLATAAIVGYIAGAPFLLQEVHGVSPGVYGALFGVNAIAMIVAAQVNAQIVERVGTGRMLAIGVAVLVASGALLTVVEVAGLGLVPTALAYLLTMTAWGLIPPNAIALGMAAHPEIAGAASAMLGVFQYGLGGLAAPLAGLGGATSGLASGLLILVCGLLAAATFAAGQRWDASRRVVAG
jgi:MFS transporter, DHA1 family, multidrug resistance protein